MTKSTLNSFIEHIQVEYLYNSILSRFGRRKEFIIESLGQVNNIDKYVKNFEYHLEKLLNSDDKYIQYDETFIIRNISIITPIIINKVNTKGSYGDTARNGSFVRIFVDEVEDRTPMSIFTSVFAHEITHLHQILNTNTKQNNQFDTNYNEWIRRISESKVSASKTLSKFLYYTTKLEMNAFLGSMLKEIEKISTEEHITITRNPNQFMKNFVVKTNSYKAYNWVKNFVIYLNQLDESKYELYEKAWTNINGNLKSKRNMHFKQILNKINTIWTRYDKNFKITVGRTLVQLTDSASI